MDLFFTCFSGCGICLVKYIQISVIQWTSISNKSSNRCLFNEERFYFHILAPVKFYLRLILPFRVKIFVTQITFQSTNVQIALKHVLTVYFNLPNQNNHQSDRWKCELVFFLSNSIFTQNFTLFRAGGQLSSWTELKVLVAQFETTKHSVPVKSKRFVKL